MAIFTWRAEGGPDGSGRFTEVWVKQGADRKVTTVHLTPDLTYEYACHEGNSMEGRCALAVPRSEEPVRKSRNN